MEQRITVFITQNLTLVSEHTQNWLCYQTSNMLPSTIWQELWRSVWPSVTVTLHLRKVGNPNLTKRFQHCWNPSVSHLWQQSVCSLKCTPSQVSASESSPQQCPWGMVNGLMKAAGLKHLTPQLACKGQGWVLAMDWMCFPTSLQEEELAASTQHAGCPTHPSTNSRGLFR